MIHPRRPGLRLQVERLCYPPTASDAGWSFDPYIEGNRVGIPVAPFPQGVRSPQCDRLAPMTFVVSCLMVAPYRPHRTHRCRACGG